MKSCHSGKGVHWGATLPGFSSQDPCTPRLVPPLWNGESAWGLAWNGSPAGHRPLVAAPLDPRPWESVGISRQAHPSACDSASSRSTCSTMWAANPTSVTNATTPASTGRTSPDTQPCTTGTGPWEPAGWGGEALGDHSSQRPGPWLLKHQKGTAVHPKSCGSKQVRCACRSWPLGPLGQLWWTLSRGDHDEPPWLRGKLVLLRASKVSLLFCK